MILRFSNLAIVALTAAVWLSGCTVVPERLPPPLTHDLGEQLNASPLTMPAVTVVVSAQAPSWLNSTAVPYRMPYLDATELKYYNDTHWIAAPVELVSERLKQRLHNAEPGYSPTGGRQTIYRLELRLEQFEQVFVTPASAEGRIRVHATLTNARTRERIAQSTVQETVACPTPDGPGGVQALANAAHGAVEQIAQWASASVSSVSPHDPRVGEP
ncbi:MAG: ABC-type transport auxiliary lipoprotein family protein [Pseudomonadota bacterium]|nr:ABC-type transport auxiliary lipoprotein family protein [Pseudomonadota bacterium]